MGAKKLETKMAAQKTKIETYIQNQIQKLNPK